ncbi:MAG: DUF7948 domain-containing protein [Bacteroidia bacterium]
MTLTTCVIGLFTIGWTQNRQASLSTKSSIPNSPLNHLFFIENKGQWPWEVLYLARLRGMDAWITKKGVVYTFYKPEEPSFENFHRCAQPPTLTGHTVLHTWQNPNPTPIPQGYPKEGYYNYLIGNDPSKHATCVGLYKEVVVQNAYDGIDVRYYFDKGALRYDYVVHPGADPAQITFVLEGSQSTYLNSQGNLVFTTSLGESEIAELRCYQAHDLKPISARFVRKGQAWGIDVATYDLAQVLIIDPVVYSTFVGGDNNDRAFAITTDASGYVYITGHTYSLNYSTTIGAFQSTRQGTYNVFVTKLDPTGTTLVYSTYIGGSNLDEAFGIAVDGSGHAYITGITASTDYDVTSNALYGTYRGGAWDAFFTKLNPSGTALVYSTFLGGNDHDDGRAIALDANGDIYIAGHTLSTDYPTTPGAYQTSKDLARDVVVSKLNASGSALVYSTHIGGDSYDEAYGIDVDNSGHAYITGFTESSNYDTTAGAYQTTKGGGMWDAFVTKLNPTGTGLVYSTYLGGSETELARGIAIDAAGNPYITGATRSSNYATTAGAYQNTFAGGAWDAFVTKLNSAGTALEYSTYLGGSSWDYAHGIAVDNLGYAYVVGRTDSPDYDTTAGAFQTTPKGGYDVFVTKLDPTGSALEYSTYLGGTSDDEGYAIAIQADSLYVTGTTYSADYVITTGAVQETKKDRRDVFVTKLVISSPSTQIPKHHAPTTYPNPTQGSVTFYVPTPTTLEICDMTGRILWRLPVIGSTQVELPLPTGMYLLRDARSGNVEKLHILK